MAGPVGSLDDRTAAYFQSVIHDAQAPVICGMAGGEKGKAIFATQNVPAQSRLWTESPYVAMRHESSNASASPTASVCSSQLPCCAHCFAPLVHSYQALWDDLVARHNAAAPSAPVTSQDLDQALVAAGVDARTCGLSGPMAECVCGIIYCSRTCQAQANREYHSLLCPRDDPTAPMQRFVAHLRQTNDIFLLAAKVVARVLSHFIVSRDPVAACEPVSMFYKRPRRAPVKTEPQAAEPQSVYDVDDIRGPWPVGFETYCLQELLCHTHALLLQALEFNLRRLEREQQLQGLSVAEIWTACGSVLTLDFFAEQLGSFEANNIRLDVDHPFKALLELLEPDVYSEGASVVAEAADRIARVRTALEQSQTLNLEDIEGTALFPIICTMNHSCRPNCTVLYTNNGDAHVVAVRDIAAGEELCICYVDIDQDLAAREASLREYRFTCACLRCLEERQTDDESDHSSVPLEQSESIAVQS